MSFGFATRIALLSWAIVVLLGIKLVATLVLLTRDPATRTTTRSGARLWWATKLTPPIAVPCMIAIALMQRRDGELWIYALLMLFVAIAVPVKIVHRRRALRRAAGGRAAAAISSRDG